MDQSQHQGNEMIEIDGSMNEGGGQIFRMSLALSVVLRKPFRIINIRRSRPNPGLNNQLISVVLTLELQYIELVSSIVKANISGVNPGSLEVTFFPLSDVEGGPLQCGSKSAASTGLMLQCLLPILLFAKNNSQLSLKGGTTVSNSPPSKSIQNCFVPLLQRMDIDIKYDIVKEGYYPIGNGIVKIAILPCRNGIKPITIKSKTPLKQCYIKFILTKDLPFKEYVKDIVKVVQNIQVPGQEESKDQEAVQVQIESSIIVAKKFKEVYGVIVNALSLPNVYDSSLILMKDQSLLQVMEKVTEKLQSELASDSCLDEFHQDQLLIFMALATGKSEICVGPTLSEHTVAAFYVLKKFISDLEIDVTDQTNSKLISITGIGKKAL